MRQYIVPFILMVATVVMAYLYLQDPQSPDLLPDLETQGGVPYNEVDQLRRETAIKVGIDQQRLAVDRAVGGPELDPGRARNSQYHKTQIRDSVEPRPLRPEDLEGKAINLDQRMDLFLAKKQYYEELERSEKEAYVKGFVAEARKMGFIVEIDDNFEITEVKKIPSN